MFWAGIVGNLFIDLFKVDDGVNRQRDEFLSMVSFPVLQFQNIVHVPITQPMYMHDTAPAHVSQCTKTFLASKNISRSKIMNWPPSSLDLNCIGNLWRIVKT